MAAVVGPSEEHSSILDASFVGPSYLEVSFVGASFMEKMAIKGEFDPLVSFVGRSVDDSSIVDEIAVVDASSGNTLKFAQ